MSIMPWKETEPMTEKEHFVTLAQTGRFTMAELCADFGISRKTGHKYLVRHVLILDFGVLGSWFLVGET